MNGRVHQGSPFVAIGRLHLAVIVVAVAVTPGPVLFLLFRRNMAKIAMLVIVIFACPLMVINILIVVPDVIITVIRIVDPVIMVVIAGSAEDPARHRSGEYAEIQKL